MMNFGGSSEEEEEEEQEEEYTDSLGNTISRSEWEEQVCCDLTLVLTAAER